MENMDGCFDDNCRFDRRARMKRSYQDLKSHHRYIALHWFGLINANDLHEVQNIALAKVYGVMGRNYLVFNRLS